MDPVDLLVIGGGVNGAGIARDAAGRGLSVLLAEKDDLAQGTSSRSGKYIHGGLRYLEYYEFRLVREALIEREVLLKAAPHIIWPMRLILPHSPEQRPRWLIRLGLFLYDHLGGRISLPKTRALDLRRVPEGAVVRDEFTRAFQYSDCWVDDARLVVLNALDAARLGARVLTRTEVVAARREGALWAVTLRNALSGVQETVRARAIVNAAGPWVERVLGAVAGVNSARRVRLVKGSHLITRRWWQGDHGYVLQGADRRLIFVNPYFDDLALIGTTDIPFDGRVEDAAADESEIAYLLAILNRYFKTTLTRDEVLSTFSGVRPLFDDDSAKNASAVTRDYTFELGAAGGEAPILSVFGGKITTYRKLAEHALQRLQPFFPELRPAWTAGAPLPGGDLPGGDFQTFQANFRARHRWMPASLAGHLTRAYGSMAEDVIGGATSVGELGQHFGGDLYEAEARWMVTREWAMTPEDVLFRRSKHGLFLAPAERQRLESWMQRERAA